MKVLIDLPTETEDEIVVKSLRESREDLSKTKALTFSNDRNEDRKLIRKHLQALDLIIKYYSIDG